VGVDQDAHQICRQGIPWLTIMWEVLEGRFHITKFGLLLSAHP